MTKQLPHFEVSDCQITNADDPTKIIACVNTMEYAALIAPPELLEVAGGVLWLANNIEAIEFDRVQFRRRVHELQEMVPRIITDSNGRPLKSAQDKVDDFVAGSFDLAEDGIVRFHQNEGTLRTLLAT